MATLHFDTDAGRTVLSRLTAASQVFDEQVVTLVQEVNHMIGSEWIGNSATQYEAEFRSWSHQMRQVQANLESLRQRLETEIADWEQAASALN